MFSGTSDDDSLFQQVASIFFVFVHVDDSAGVVADTSVNDSLLFDRLSTLADNHTYNVARYFDDKPNTVVIVAWLVLLSLQQPVVVVNNLAQQCFDLRLNNMFKEISKDK